MTREQNDRWGCTAYQLIAVGIAIGVWAAAWLIDLARAS